MKRLILLLVGLLLIAFCIGWFLGPVRDVVMPMIEPAVPASGEISDSTRNLGRRARPRQIGGFDMNTVLNAANAVIGFAGLVLAMRAGRARS